MKVHVIPVVMAQLPRSKEGLVHSTNIHIRLIQVSNLALECVREGCVLSGGPLNFSAKWGEKYQIIKCTIPCWR